MYVQATLFYAIQDCLMKAIFILDLFVCVSNTEGEVSLLHFITNRRFLLVVRCISSMKLILGSHYSAHYAKAIRNVKARRNPSKLKQYRSGRENLISERVCDWEYKVFFFSRGA